MSNLATYSAKPTYHAEPPLTRICEDACGMIRPSLQDAQYQDWETMWEHRTIVGGSGEVQS